MIIFSPYNTRAGVNMAAHQAMPGLPVTNQPRLLGQSRVYRIESHSDRRMLLHVFWTINMQMRILFMRWKCYSSCTTRMNLWWTTICKHLNFVDACPSPWPFFRKLEERREFLQSDHSTRNELIFMLNFPFVIIMKRYVSGCIFI